MTTNTELVSDLLVALGTFAKTFVEADEGTQREIFEELGLDRGRRGYLLGYKASFAIMGLMLEHMYPDNDKGHAEGEIEYCRECGAILDDEAVPDDE